MKTEEVMMKTPAIIVLIGILLAPKLSARYVDFSSYDFTKMAELIVQGEVVESQPSGPYKIKVEKVLKGKYSEPFIDLPYRYYYGRSIEKDALSLSVHEKGVFFLQFTRNGDHDQAYQMELKRGGDPDKNRKSIPYVAGYEIVAESFGVQKGTDEELTAYGNAIVRTDKFLSSFKTDLLVDLFTSTCKSSRNIALHALKDNPELFRANRELFGKCLVQCLKNADIATRNLAASLIAQFDYREATTVLNSYTNAPNTSFRKTVLSTLKTFELRTSTQQVK